MKLIKLSIFCFIHADKTKMLISLPYIQSYYLSDCRVSTKTRTGGGAQFNTGWRAFSSTPPYCDS